MKFESMATYIMINRIYIWRDVTDGTYRAEIFNSNGDIEIESKNQKSMSEILDTVKIWLCNMSIKDGKS